MPIRKMAEKNVKRLRASRNRHFDELPRHLVFLDKQKKIVSNDN